MANEYNETPLDTCVIPENFVDTGRCFNGMFRTRNLAEGVLFAAPPAFLLSHLNLPLNQKIVVIAIVAGGIFLFCVAGINGDSVVEFVTHLIGYNKRKRVAKYNPRVKTEATPGYLTKEGGELPRDKILRMVNNIKSTEEKREEPVSRDIYDPLYKEFFEDDLGQLATPDGLKSKKELHKEAKERKRQEKQAARDAKNAAKAAKKAAKKTKKGEAK